MDRGRHLRYFVSDYESELSSDNSFTFFLFRVTHRHWFDLWLWPCWLEIMLYLNERKSAYCSATAAGSQCNRWGLWWLFTSWKSAPTSVTHGFHWNSRGHWSFWSLGSHQHLSYLRRQTDQVSVEIVYMLFEDWVQDEFIFTWLLASVLSSTLVLDFFCDSRFSSD